MTHVRWWRAGVIPLMLAAVASNARGQQVLLQLRPHAGDTLHMRLDQEMDVTRTGQAALGDVATEVTTTWVVLQRMIVERTDTTGTEILQVTDSVSTGGLGSRSQTSDPRRARPAVDGSQVLLHVAPDGAVTLLDSANSVSSALREVLKNLPVTFPRDPVEVGHHWVRSMKLPAGAGYGQGGEIKLEFRLDSVSDGDSLAYVSVRGPLGEQRVNGAIGGMAVTTRRTMAGTMVIDRQRGWLTDWHATIDVEYDMQPPKGSNQPPGRMRMTAMQWLRAVDRP